MNASIDRLREGGSASGVRKDTVGEGDECRGFTPLRADFIMCTVSPITCSFIVYKFGTMIGFQRGTPAIPLV